MKSHNLDSELDISCKIWDKETKELTSSNNAHYTKTKFKINTSGVLYRKDNKVYFTQDENQEKSDSELLRITKKNETYSVDCGALSKDINSLINQDGAYIVHRVSKKGNNTNRYYKLNEGDIIKIGKYYLKILNIHINKNKIFNKSRNNNNFQDSIINNSHTIIMNNHETIRDTFYIGENKKSIDYYLKEKNEYSSHNQKMSKCNEVKINLNENFMKICRICYGDESTIENPLLYPCLCNGSVKYIHYECLKNLINSKIEIDFLENKEKNIICYFRKDILCELCKEKFPDYIKYNNRYYNIAFYKPKFNEYIVIESIKNEINHDKFIQIISFDDRDIAYLGSKKDSEISVNRQSINDYYCIIHKRKDYLDLEDNNSKFGTFILVQYNNLIINNSLPLNLQISNTFIKIKVPKKKSSSFFCCEEPPTFEQSNLNYQMQNELGLDFYSNFNIKDNVDEQDEKEFNDNDMNKKIKFEDEESDLIDNNNINIFEHLNKNTENKKRNKSLKIKNIIIKNFENELNRKLLTLNVNRDKNFSRRIDNNFEIKTTNLISGKKYKSINIALEKTNQNQNITDNQNISDVFNNKNKK